MMWHTPLERGVARVTGRIRGTYNGACGVGKSRDGAELT
jgi:hypothetical protein